MKPANYIPDGFFSNSDGKPTARQENKAWFNIGLT